MKNFTVAVYKWLPWIDYEKSSSGYIYNLKGVMKYIMQKAEELLEARFIYVEPLDAAWGKMLPNGNFTGMVGMIQRKECDLAVGPFTVTLQRSLVVRYTSVLYMDYVAILSGYKHAKGDEVGLEFEYVHSLDQTVWIFFFISLIVSVMYSTIDYFNNKKETSCLEIVHIALIVFIKYFGAACGQGQVLYFPKAVDKFQIRPAQLVFLIWYLSTIIIMDFCFSDGILSKLVVIKPLPQLSSFQDFQIFSDVTPILEKGTSVESILEHSETEDVNYVWQLIQNDPNTTLKRGPEFKSNDSIENIKSGKWAGITDAITLSSIIPTEQAFDFLLSEQNLPLPTAVAYSKTLSSKTSRKLSISVDWVVSAGLVMKAIGDDRSKIEICLLENMYKRPSSSLEPLQVHQVANVFFLLSFGLTVAFAVFLVETVVQRFTLRLIPKTHPITYKRLKIGWSWLEVSRNPSQYSE